MKGLYPIIDLDACRSRALDPRFVAEAVLEVGPPLLQLRAKGADCRTNLGLLRDLQAMVASTATRLVANDRPDLALIAGCAGVHVGQSDLPCSEVRKLDARLLVGVSTHTLPELREALAERPDYVAFGPIYDTGSKQAPEATVGADGLALAHEHSAAGGIPLVAIGGIHIGNLAPLLGHVELVAVISALLSEDRQTIRERAKVLHEQVAGA